MNYGILGKAFVHIKTSFSFCEAKWDMLSLLIILIKTINGSRSKLFHFLEINLLISIEVLHLKDYSYAPLIKTDKLLLL